MQLYQILSNISNKIRDSFQRAIGNIATRIPAKLATTKIMPAKTDPVKIAPDMRQDEARTGVISYHFVNAPPVICFRMDGCHFNIFHSIFST